MVLPPVPQAVSRPKKKKPKVDYIQSMQKLDIRDGDVIVLKTDVKLTPKQTAVLKDQWLKLYSGLKNAEVIVLEDGMDIGVLRKEPPVLKLKDGYAFTPLTEGDTRKEVKGGVPNKPTSPPPCPQPLDTPPLPFQPPPKRSIKEDVTARNIIDGVLFKWQRMFKRKEK